MKLLEKIWLFFAKKKLDSDDRIPRYNALLLFGKFGNDSSIDALIPFLSNGDTMIRNAAVLALKQILSRSEDRDDHFDLLKLRYEKAELIEKLAVISVLEVFSISVRENLLRDYLERSEGDLIYAILASLHGTTDQEILNRVLKISESNDLLLRRLSYTVWFEGLKGMDKVTLMKYVTPLIHYLIRSTYEMKNDGSLLRDVLSNADRRDLPSAKAYPEFITRYLISLINKWEYDPDIYRSLHNLVVPAYFTFEAEGDRDNRPYIIV